MRAVLLRAFGDPSSLKVEEVPTPAPKADEVLVAVHAAGINPSDVKNVRGTMHGTTLPRIPGRDFAGIVAAGPAELIGEEVFGSGGDIGFTRDGSHAHYILLPREAITPKPHSLEMEDAGSAGLVFVTAWTALVTAARVGAGDIAIIIGASGGVGSAAVQIAKARGAKVIGVVKSQEQIPAAIALGAEQAVASAAADFQEKIKSLTHGRGGNVVFDSSGTMFAEAIEMAAEEGRVPVISAPADGKVTFNLRSIYRKRMSVFGVDSRALDAVACAPLLAEMSPYFESGQFRVLPADAFALDDAVAAYGRVSSGGTRVVLRISQ